MLIAPRKGRFAINLGVLLAAELAVVAVFAAAYDAFDFHVYALGGRAVAHDQQLYQFQWHEKGFTYPPFAAVLFRPLAALPLPVSRVVWDLGSVLALGLSVRAVRVLTGRVPDGRTIAALVAAALPLEPVWHTLFLGQVNLLLLAAVLLDAQRVARGRTAGIGIGVAAAIKLTPTIFIVVLYLAGRRRSANLAVLTAAAGTLLGALVAPHASARYWGGYFCDAGRVGRAAYVSDQSLHGLFSRWHPTGIVAALPALLPVVVAVAGVIAAAVRARRSQWLDAIVIAAVTGLLVSPISWSHHWVWVVPGLVALHDAGGRARIAAGAGYLLFLATPIWWVPHPQPGPLAATLATNAYALAGLGYLGYAVRSTRRRLTLSRPEQRYLLARAAATPE